MIVIVMMVVLYGAWFFGWYLPKVKRPANRRGTRIVIGLLRSRSLRRVG